MNLRRIIEAAILSLLPLWEEVSRSERRMR